MAAPALKDLPKVDETLKSQLEGFSTNRLSHTETQEKVVLPSAEGELNSFYKNYINYFTEALNLYARTFELLLCM